MEIQLRDKNFRLGNFGIEIEMYGINKSELSRRLNNQGIRCAVEGYNHFTREHWKIVSDVSISRERSCELVSPVLNGERGLETINIVCQIINDLGGKVGVTCGLHVHHEAVGFSFETLHKVANVYRRIEKHVDGFMPKSRRASNHRLLRSVVTAPDCAFTDRNEGYRYFKVNCQSWFRHGTVEFRHHSGTTEFKKIKHWVLFTACIVEKARGRVVSQQALKRWVDVKWYLGLTTAAISQDLKAMVKYYTKRRKAFAAEIAAEEARLAAAA